MSAECLARKEIKIQINGISEWDPAFLWLKLLIHVLVEIDQISLNSCFVLYDTCNIVCEMEINVVELNC